LENHVGIPIIPKRMHSIEKVAPPDAPMKKVSGIDQYEHSWQLLLHIVGQGIRHMPRLMATILLPLAVVTVINIALESIPTYSLYGFGKVVVMTLVFLTASYNSVIPRTIFWVIVFTVGRTLLRRVRSEGFGKVVGDFRQFPVNFKASKAILGQLSNALLITGAGLGFFTANFLTRNNRIDKVLVCFVLATALINALSKGKSGLLFTSVKLVYQDLTAMVKSAGKITADHTYLIVSGFILGLLGNTVFAVIKLDFGGYILGGVLAAFGLFMVLNKNKEVK